MLSGPNNGRGAGGAGFNPYGLLAIHIPIEVLRYRNLSWGAKCLYGRLALFRGRKAGGFCTPERGEMAAAMNAKASAVDHWLKELVDEKFIARVRHRGPTACVFLPHPCFADSAKKGGEDAAEPSQNCGIQTDHDSAILRSQDSADLRNGDGSRVGNSANKILQNCEVDFADLRNAYKKEGKTFTKTLTKTGDGGVGNSETSNPENGSNAPEGSKAPLLSEIESGELFPIVPAGAAKRTTSRRTPSAGKELLVEPYATAIFTRHPRVRRCPLAEVNLLLGKILKPASPSECEPLLRRINANHIAHCASEQWQKDGGRYAKGLSNWLAPTMKRWEEAPASSAEASPGYKPPENLATPEKQAADRERRSWEGELLRERDRAQAALVNSMPEGKTRPSELCEKIREVSYAEAS
ncbi:MAG: hypothetical protein LAQ69_32035 [Acidobacteriia bacterium]|nr:hypothetical protein [Terriglobia bacterium]